MLKEKIDTIPVPFHNKPEGNTKQKEEEKRNKVMIEDWIKQKCIQLSMKYKSKFKKRGREKKQQKEQQYQFKLKLLLEMYRQKKKHRKNF